MDILGISSFFHDAAAALLRHGQLLAAAEEERFTRKKHDYEFPSNAIEFCLRTREIAARDLDYGVFFEKPCSSGCCSRACRGFRARTHCSVKR